MGYHKIRLQGLVQVRSRLLLKGAKTDFPMHQPFRTVIATHATGIRHSEIVLDHRWPSGAKFPGLHSRNETRPIHRAAAQTEVDSGLDVGTGQIDEMPQLVPANEIDL